MTIQVVVDLSLYDFSHKRTFQITQETKSLRFFLRPDKRSLWTVNEKNLTSQTSSMIQEESKDLGNNFNHSGSLEFIRRCTSPFRLDPSSRPH